jgi:hypothetical protein
MSPAIGEEFPRLVIAIEAPISEPKIENEVHI